MSCLLCFWWWKHRWIKKKLLVSHWNLIFWFYPHARDKEFSYKKEKDIFVTIISLKSQVSYTGRSGPKMSFTERFFCIGLVFVTNRCTDKKDTSSYWFRWAGAKPVVGVCPLSWLYFNHRCYFTSLIVILPLQHLVLYTILYYVMFIYLLDTFILLWNWTNWIVDSKSLGKLNKGCS